MWNIITISALTLAALAIIGGVVFVVMKVIED